jgi:hypothetical protein
MTPAAFRREQLLDIQLVLLTEHSRGRVDRIVRRGGRRKKCHDDREGGKECSAAYDSHLKLSVASAKN